jgi:phosphoribosylformylglycinamidine synthase
MRDVVAKAKAGTPVLGICNGFQILCEVGLLPGVLLRNASMKYICRDVLLKVEQTDSLFTRRYRQGQVVRIPIAHGDGNYFADDQTIRQLENEGRVAFRYADRSGNATSVANPNGSKNNIAGIFDERRRVLGMMPHPERLADPALGGTDGKALFESIVGSTMAAA